jgi:hypothetical protein
MYLADLAMTCLDDAHTKQLVGEAEQKKGAAVLGQWIQYTFSGANAWGSPVGEVQVQVQSLPHHVASFCWDGPVEQASDGGLRAVKTKWAPGGSVRVYFLGVGQ